MSEPRAIAVAAATKPATQTFGRRLADNAARIPVG